MDERTVERVSFVLLGVLLGVAGVAALLAGWARACAATETGPTT